MSMLPYYHSFAKAHEVLQDSSYGARGSRLRAQHHITETTIAGSCQRVWMIQFIPSKAGGKR